MRRTVITALVLAALTGAAGGPSHAQSASSSLAGDVRFDDGTPVNGAVVQARDQATGAVRSTVSDAPPSDAAVAGRAGIQMLL